MLKQLKRKFIITNMLLVGIVLFLVLSTICFSSYRSSINNMKRGLMDALTRPANMPEFGPQIGGGANFDANKYTAVVTVIVDSAGEILQLKENNVSISNDVLQKAIDMCLTRDTNEGALHELSLYYVQGPTPDGLKIVLGDTTHITDSLKNILTIMFVIGVVSLAIFYLISRVLANMALKPVERAWSQQRQFVADASHELKTPLTVILANNNILQSHPNDSIHDQLKWINSTQEEVLHMKRLIDDLLYLAKTDDIRLETLPERLNLTEIIWNCTLQFEPVAYERGIQISSKFTDSLFIMGDRAQITQLIYILLDNACKHAPKDTQISASLFKNGSTVTFSITNEGAIPKEVIPHIFERFYRGNEARTSDGSYGLGLAIAKNIAKLNNCRIILDSQNGETTFMLKFKIANNAK